VHVRLRFCTIEPAGLSPPPSCAQEQTVVCARFLCWRHFFLDVALQPLNFCRLKTIMFRHPKKRGDKSIFAENPVLEQPCQMISPKRP
jgi:hypothetical protein